MQQWTNKASYLEISWFPGSLDGKASVYNAGDPGSIPGLGRSPGEGNGNPLQYSCLENPMDRGAWWATVHGVAKSRTRLSDFSSSLLVETDNTLCVCVCVCVCVCGQWWVLQRKLRCSEVRSSWGREVLVSLGKVRECFSTAGSESEARGYLRESQHREHQGWGGRELSVSAEEENKGGRWEQRGMGDREWSQRVSLATVVTLAFTRREIVFQASFSVSAHNPSYLFPNSHIHPPPFCLPSSHPISGCHQLLNSHGNITKPRPFSCFFPHSPLALGFHIISS